MKKIIASSKCISTEHIQQYLRGEMEEAQQHQLENHLLDCPLCSDAVEGYANHYNFEEDGELADLQKQFSPPTASVRPLVRTGYFNRIAAAITLLLIIGAAVLYWQNTTDERLYHAYHQGFQEDLLANVRSSTSTAENAPLIQQALTYYEAKDYEQSAMVFEQYLKTDPQHTPALFMSALAQLEIGQTAAALDRLMAVRINDEQLYEDASWYLILAHIRMGNRAEAKALVTELLKLEDGYYYEKLIDLSKQLKD